MKILLDTHAFIWWAVGDARLSKAAADAIADPENGVFLSSASVWEIIIKSRLGKLILPEPVEQFIPRELATSHIAALSITHAHALRVSQLPDLHNDPFDRMLIAQALAETMTIASRDENVRRYPVATLW